MGEDRSPLILGSMLSHGRDSWKTPFVWFAITGVVIAAIVLFFVPPVTKDVSGMLFGARSGVLPTMMHRNPRMREYSSGVCVTSVPVSDHRRAEGSGPRICGSVVVDVKD